METGLSFRPCLQHFSPVHVLEQNREGKDRESWDEAWAEVAVSMLVILPGCGLEKQTDEALVSSSVACVAY